MDSLINFNLIKRADLKKARMGIGSPYLNILVQTFTSSSMHMVSDHLLISIVDMKDTGGKSGDEN